MTDRTDSAYLETLDRMESVAMVDDGAGWASCSVSLKRIADHLERDEARKKEKIEKWEAAMKEWRWYCERDLEIKASRRWWWF